MSIGLIASIMYHLLIYIKPIHLINNVESDVVSVVKETSKHNNSVIF